MNEPWLRDRFLFGWWFLSAFLGIGLYVLHGRGPDASGSSAVVYASAGSVLGFILPNRRIVWEGKLRVPMLSFLGLLASLILGLPLALFGGVSYLFT